MSWLFTIEAKISISTVVLIYIWNLVLWGQLRAKWPSPPHLKQFIGRSLIWYVADE
jgi:hypothetical protein